jgi:dihydropyrimidinase
MMFETFDAHVRDHVGVMDLAGRHGLTTMLHCEDACVVSVLAEKLLAGGASDASHYGEARPAYAEAVSVARAVAFSEATGAPIYLVHVSSADALEVAQRAKARGVPVTVETRPIYLFFDEDRMAGPDGGLYIGNPPLRARENVSALWGGLRTGAIDTCCTDHAPATRAEKLDESRTIATVSPGMGELDTLMPLLFSNGVRTGAITLERFVELTSTNAAKAFGLYPRKGTIAVGGDADLLVWDPEASRTFSAEAAESNADFSLYEGWEITGHPAITISRGEVVYRDGEITAPSARGRLVTRPR